MNQIKSLTHPKIYVSPQHGALITIISVNLVSILHSEKMALFQIFAFVFSLSSFHVAEIFFLPSHAKEKEKKWFITYSLLTLISATIIVIEQSQIALLLAGLLLLCSFFLLLQYKPKFKTIFHLVSFALIIWISLFSLTTQSPKLLLNLFIQLLVYFSFTVALIHWRLGKLPSQTLHFIVISSLTMCMFLHNWPGIIALTSILAFKWLLIIFTKSYWSKAPLKIFGYEETIFLSIYIYLMTTN